MKKIFGLFVFVFVLVLLVSANVYAATDGIYTYYIHNNTAIITDCSTTLSGDIVIPDKLGNYPVTSIDTGAFSGCSSLTGVTIPEGVTTIGSSAFKNCSSLTAITMPDTIKNVDNAAFEGCKNLVKVNITDVKNWCEIAFFDVSSNPLYYAKNLYVNNNLITDLVIPEGVSSIPYATFYNCTGFESVTFPDSLTSVGQMAFYGCTNISKVHTNDIGNWCEIDFYDVTANPLFYANKLYLNGNPVTNVIIPDGTTKIGSCAFARCYDIKNLTIPDSVTSIGTGAFNRCTGLTEVIIPDFLTRIGSSAFYGCTSLENVIIGNHVESIGDSAFYNCSELADVTVPDSVVSVGGSAFNNCTSLKSVVLGNGVKSIGSYAFSGCSNLEKLVLGNSVESIEAYAFSDCASLNGITFPDSVKTVYHGLFRNCDLVICANSDTRMHEYARDYEIPFVDIKEISNFESGIKLESVATSSGKNIFVVNSRSMDENAYIIVALYNQKQLSEYKAFDNKNEIVYLSSTLPFDVAKATVWNSFGFMKPLCVAHQIK